MQHSSLLKPRNDITLFIPMKNLPQIRYYLEIISVPVFAWLVVHLSGEALSMLPQIDAHPVGYDHHELGWGELLSIEFLGGLMALALFILLWHQPFLKKLVPCSHDHCHHKTIWPHLAATVAFVFHWFPESAVRYEVLSNFSIQDVTQMAAALGFASHFLVDILLVYLLSTFWPKFWQRLTSIGVMVVAWLGSFWLGEQGGLPLEGAAEPMVLLVSAFLLAMFVHKPHKPKQKHSCEGH